MNADKSPTTEPEWGEIEPGIYVRRRTAQTEAEDTCLWNESPTALLSYAVANMRRVS